MTKKKLISAYCDGSSGGNSKGPIGWGWLITDWEDIVDAGSEGDFQGTNNIAELNAAVSALKCVVDKNLHQDNEVELVSDSTYVLGLADGSFQPGKYHDTVRTLRSLVVLTQAKCRWVRGHSGDAFNDKVDQLAKAAKERHYTTQTDSRKRRKMRKKEERRRKRRLVRLFKSGLIASDGTEIGRT